MYIAKKHIGNVYMPGDVLPDNVNPATVEWLMRVEAIEEIASTPSVFDGQQADGEVSGDDVGQSFEAGTDDDVFDDDEEIPVINAMDGIVKDEPEQSEKAAASKAPRAAGKKAPKGGKAK